MKFSLKAFTTVLLLGMLALIAWGQPLVAPASSADNYYKHVLDGGKLQRFNDSTRIIYYRVDTLSGSSSWDYTKWNFTKDELVREAFDVWEKALNGQISFRQTFDPKKTDIAVHWRTGFQDKNLLGFERPRYTYNQYLVDADVQITLTRSGKLLSDKELRAVAIHEIGHALGMNGHSPYPGDLMFYSIQPGVYTLSARDVRTIRLMYNQEPDITNPPGVHLAQYRQALQYFQKGLKDYQRKNSKQAYQNFVKAYSSYPSDPHYATMAGLTAYDLDRYLEAIGYLEKALPKVTQMKQETRYALADAQLMQAQTDMQNGNASRALKLLKQSKSHFEALLKDPKTSKALKKDIASRRTWVDKHLSTLLAKG